MGAVSSLLHQRLGRCPLRPDYFGVLLPPIGPRILWWRNPFLYLPQAPTHPHLPVLSSGIFCLTPNCSTRSYSLLQPGWTVSSLHLPTQRL